MRKAALAILLMLGTAAAADPVPPRVLIASDSTAANYASSQFPQMGWGMFLGCSLDPDIAVVNKGRGGRSTRTFLSEGLWSALLAEVRPGDTVLIQFGHNDEDLTKLYRHTDANGEYRANLERFVRDVRARQGDPVLVTPVARHAFRDGHIRATHGDYAKAVIAAARATGTPLVDLDADSRAFFDRQGEATSARYFMIYTPADHIARFPEGHTDTTHLNELGARATARIVANALARLKLPVSRRARPADPGAAVARGNASCS
ncbi:rhamnogalacturonan acetylesterase [Sphingomonas sp. DT-204]|uniref:rhamnogalacturonan acetylesterase n=1 Tax=Sphingomonas sp. DT-204 TaxID=3396166 RepID=UPI003F1D16BF